MRGLMARILESLVSNQPADPLDEHRAEIAASVARRKAERCARPVAGEARRFERARPKVEQLQRELAGLRP